MAEPKIDDLATFVRVLEHGSFAAAARALGVPTSTVSRAVARLEADASVRLVQRTTRSLRATSEGQALFTSVAPAVAALRDAARTLEPASNRPRGRLRVTAPVDLCATFLADVLASFTRAYPHVQLDFTLTGRQANLVEGGFDVALRATAHLQSSELVARKLIDVDHALYASPDYLARAGVPASPQELPQHPCIVFRGEELRRTWTLRRDEELVNVEIAGRLGGDDFSFVRAMALAGAGIGLLPRILCRSDEANGRLVRVLPDYCARGATLYLVLPSAKNLPARVRAFRDFMTDAFRSP